MRIFLATLCLMTTILYSGKSYSSEMFNSHDIYKESTSVEENVDREYYFIENMSYMINRINQKDYLNEDKKRVLYQKVLFLYKSIISADSEEAFTTYIVNDFFNLSLCIPYLLRTDSAELVGEIYHMFEDIESEENIMRYKKIYDIIHSEEIESIAGDYIRDNVENVDHICFSNDSFSSSNDIIEIL